MVASCRIMCLTEVEPSAKQTALCQRGHLHWSGQNIWPNKFQISGRWLAQTGAFRFHFMFFWHKTVSSLPGFHYVLHKRSVHQLPFVPIPFGVCWSNIVNHCWPDIWLQLQSFQVWAWMMCASQSLRSVYWFTKMSPLERNTIWKPPTGEMDFQE